MKYDLKNILIGIAIGILGTILVFSLIGQVDIQTDIQIGKNLDQENKNISISIEKNIDDNGEEIVIVDAIGKGSVTMEDIENELGKVFTDQNIDASSGIEVNITLDDEMNFE